MATINLEAARPFFNAITTLYDINYPKQPIASTPINKKDPSAAYLTQAQKYNQSLTISKWYMKVDAESLLTSDYLTSSQLMTFRNIETAAMQLSAQSHLDSLGVKSEHIVHEIFLKYPPLNLLASPKSQWDSLVFRQVYCIASDTERDQILQHMEQACAQLDPKFFNTDRLIYRIQGIVTYIFRTPFVKGIAFVAVVVISQVVFVKMVNKVSDLVLADVFPRWENLLKTHSHIYAAQLASQIYYAARAFNGYIEQTMPRQIIFGKAFSYAAMYSGRFSPKLPLILTMVKNVLFPKAYLLSFYSLQSLSERSIRAFLFTFKTFSGTEHQTVKAIRTQFKDKPEDCERGLKAHALWMRLMRKGRPEELFMGGMVRFLTPSAA